MLTSRNPADHGPGGQGPQSEEPPKRRFLGRGDIEVSFEFFPPKNQAMEETLWEAIRRLEPLRPKYVSVTYGAGGSTRERTHATVARMLSETTLVPAAHLTCVNATTNEIDDIISETKFNGTSLLNNQFTSKIFQTGADGGDSMTVSLSATIDSADFNLSSITSATFNSTNLTATLNSLDSAINRVSGELQVVGSLTSRLDVKESTLMSSITNTDAAASRIMDADVAKEQLNLTKLQILQQTSTIQLAQANSSPQSVLQLFG